MTLSTHIFQLRMYLRKALFYLIRRSIDIFFSFHSFLESSKTKEKFILKPNFSFIKNIYGGLTICQTLK